MASAYFGENVKLYLAKGNGTASSFTAATDEITTKVYSFEISGGEFDSETKYLLGGASITIQKPQRPYEISMEVAIKPTESTTWDEVFFGEGLSSDTRGGPHTIGFEADDGSNKYQILFKNVEVVSFEKSVDGENELTGTLKFRLNATDENGNANIIVAGDGSAFTVS